ncbi:MAG: cation diffusion facilitator family transporter [Promethearchaeota archaeon]
MNEIRDHLNFYERPFFINIVLLLVNTVFFILKLIFGILTNSIALQADAFDNLTDIIMNITALIGILFTNKKPNERFPYGYYKMENIISLLFSLLIFFTAYTIITQSIVALMNYFRGNPKMIYPTPLVLIFLIISLLSTIVIMLYLKLIEKKTKSPIIKSEANEKLFDIFISLSVFIGFIGALFNFYILDSIIGLFIAIFIIKGGYDIFLSSTKTLLDAVIDFENRTELITLIENTPEIKKIDNMGIRSYGRYIFLELEISLSKEFPLSQINLFKNKLSHKIMNNFPSIFKIIIIIKSQEKDIIKIAIPLNNNQDLNSTISEHFGESPFFGFIEFDKGKFSKLEVLPNQYAQEEKRKGILISEWLIFHKIDKLILKNSLKKGPSLIFNNNLIEVSLTELDNINEIIDYEKINLRNKSFD